jgi:hypothetical protein
VANSRPRGCWLQPYRYKIPGATEAEKVAWYFAKLRALFLLFPVLRAVIVGVLPHGFSSEFSAEEFQLWRDAAEREGMKAGVAFGIGSTANMAVVGDRIGVVAASGGCALVELDCEGIEWEQSAARAAAVTLCTAIQKRAPRIPLYNQSWPVPTVHGNYPFEEFARFCAAWSDQRYYNDWTGLKRYRVNEGWFCESWGTEVKTEIAPNTARVLAQAPTFQGYGWADIVPSAVTCFTTYDNAACSIWCEPWPEDSFFLALRCVGELHAQGYSGPSAVWDFQADTDGLAIDGICGPATMRALGVAA